MAIQDMISLHEAGLIPDEILRKAIRSALAAWLQQSSKPTAAEQLSVVLDFVRDLKTKPIVKSNTANEQQYELPNEFWELTVGKHMKYSASYFLDESLSFDDAEEAMLKLQCERAQIKDGQTILDVGCGWGSLCIYIAENYKNCKITGITYSNTQKEYADKRCKERKLDNVKVIMADVSTFEMEETFDRVVSVETFEYITNYGALLTKIAKWMKEDSLLFIHHCCHKTFPQLYEETPNEGDISLFEGHGHEWFGKYFFSEGIFPSANLLLFFQEDVSIVDQWLVSGKHYSRTGKEYLKKFDKNAIALKPIMEKIYGKDDAVKWTSYWRTSYMFLEEMFGYNNGDEWMTGHYLFKKK